MHPIEQNKGPTNFLVYWLCFSDNTGQGLGWLEGSRLLGQDSILQHVYAPKTGTVVIGSNRQALG